MLDRKRQYSCGNEKNKLKQQSTVNTETPKRSLKYYYEFYHTLHSKLLHSSTSLNKDCMYGHRLTQSQYAMQKNIALLGNLISQMNDQRSTHISAMASHFACNSGIGYLVQRYSSNGLLPLEEFSVHCFLEGAI